MRFNELKISGAFVLELDKIGDERGFFARLFCKEVFKNHDLESDFVQMNNSLSAHVGTLRGLHYQLPPKEEVKIVRCVQGEVFDVVLDLRRDSKTFGLWQAEILSAENRKMMYVPKGCAHGFMTLQPNSEVIYFVTSPYDPHLERGVVWNDPAFGIDWPLKPEVISERDLSHPLYLSGALA